MRVVLDTDGVEIARGEVRPLGFARAAIGDALAIAEARGWRVADESDDD